MENASKALIIAGAILLSILIIGLGMYIYNMAADSFSDTGMDEHQIRAYNSTFENYGTGKISGSQARRLCDDIRTHNVASDESKQVTVTVGDGEPSTAIPEAKVEPSVVNTAKNSIKTGKQYNVKLGYAKTGLVVSVVITEVTE